MKALSIHPPYAMLIAMGLKVIELRTWKTDYRGWILICSGRAVGKFERESTISGHAIAIARLADVRPYVDETDREPSMLFEDESFEGYSWVFDAAIVIDPIPIKGQLRLFNVDVKLENLTGPDLDYDSENYVDEVMQYWLEKGYLKNLNFFED